MGTAGAHAVTASQTSVRSRRSRPCRALPLPPPRCLPLVGSPRAVCGQRHRAAAVTVEV